MRECAGCAHNGMETVPIALVYVIIGGLYCCDNKRLWEHGEEVYKDATSEIIHILPDQFYNRLTH